VISDIDGTITKSDVLGHILPAIGHDWAQSGVAQLFSKNRNNGYHIMYLSARAIGQATTTKDYLHSVKQGGVHLPDGPLFLNPDSLIHAFKREVIDRNPEEFKISCLKEIQSLFGDKNPFFAGYGNRPNVRTPFCIIEYKYVFDILFYTRMLFLTSLWVFQHSESSPSTLLGCSGIN
jgi:phosphatidate phosphatase LPIN